MNTMNSDLKVGELYHVIYNGDGNTFASPRGYSVELICSDGGNNIVRVSSRDAIMWLGCEKRSVYSDIYFFKVLWCDKIGHISCNVVLKNCKTGKETKGINYLLARGVVDITVIESRNRR